MLQKPWFKVFVWFMATFFFFLASGVVISIFRPGPSEAEAMQFMMSMMNAMDKSMMGVIMNIAHSTLMQSIISFVAIGTFPIIVVSVIAGVIIRIAQRRSGHA
ncbi:MAG TPA: hypothetical protein VEG39_20220 [Clostridia bacterium]|nr:hypothetical protein [Clostridia bacterium]